MPYGIKSDAISVISRIVLVTSFLEVFHRVEGGDAAKHVALARRGNAFDPSVVDAFLSVAQKESFWTGLEQKRVWDSVLSMEPEQSPYQYMGEEKLVDVALAMARLHRPEIAFSGRPFAQSGRFSRAHRTEDGASRARGETHLSCCVGA